METIRIYSESAATGKRLRDILYQAGYAEITAADLSAMQNHSGGGILIIYAKSNISDIFRMTEDCGCPVILLLNPDCYARYLDRARHAGIRLLLMPVAPFLLVEAVQSAIS